MQMLMHRGARTALPRVPGSPLSPLMPGGPATPGAPAGPGAPGGPIICTRNNYCQLIIKTQFKSNNNKINN